LFRVKEENSNAYFIKKVEIKPSPIHGIGGFATEPMRRGEIFESCPLLIFKQEILYDYRDDHGVRHMLSDYVMNWEKGNYAIMLGYGVIYNHSNNPNCKARRVFERSDEPNPRIEFIAMKDIQPGEELVYHYAPKLGDLYFDEAGNMHSDFYDELEMKQKKSKNWNTYYKL